MRKPLTTLTIILGIVAIIFGIIIWIFPQWLNIPGGWLILLGAIFVGVAEFGDKIKGWADFLFGEEQKFVRTNKGGKSPAATKSSVTKNIMAGKNKIRAKHNSVEINNNTMLGENQIDVSEGSKKIRPK